MDGKTRSRSSETHGKIRRWMPPSFEFPRRTAFRFVKTAIATHGAALPRILYAGIHIFSPRGAKMKKPTGSFRFRQSPRRRRGADPRRSPKKPCSFCHFPTALLREVRRRFPSNTDGTRILSTSVFLRMGVRILGVIDCHMIASVKKLQEAQAPSW